jgi:hypothetical protein
MATAATLIAFAVDTSGPAAGILQRVAVSIPLAAITAIAARLLRTPVPGRDRRARAVLRSGSVGEALVTPVLAEFVVVEPAEHVRVVVQPVGRVAHLLEIMTVITGGRLFFGPLAHDMQFLPAQLHDLGESLLEVQRVLLTDAMGWPSCG